MAFTIENNQPSSGCIRWSSLNMQYLGVNYTITDGYTNYTYVYWTPSSPTNLVITNTFPTLGADDCLIFLNKNGISLIVPTATVLDGDLVVTGSIMANAIAAGTITGDKIAAGTITANNILVGTISADKIAVNSLGVTQISAASITGDRLVVDAITAREIAAHVITANEIVAGTITATEIKTDAITSTQIAAGAITASEIAAGAITASMITAGTMSSDRISGGTIAGVTVHATNTLSLGGDTNTDGAELQFKTVGSLGYSRISTSIANRGSSGWKCDNVGFTVNSSANAHGSLSIYGAPYNYVQVFLTGDMLMSGNLEANRIEGYTNQDQISLGQGNCRFDGTGGIIRLFTSVYGAEDYGWKIASAGVDLMINSVSKFSIDATGKVVAVGGYSHIGIVPAYIWSGSIAASASYTITHNLGYYPIVSIDGTIGNLIITIDHVDANSVKIYVYINAWTGNIRLH